MILKSKLTSQSVIASFVFRVTPPRCPRLGDGLKIIANNDIYLFGCQQICMELSFLEKKPALVPDKCFGMPGEVWHSGFVSEQ